MVKPNAEGSSVGVFLVFEGANRPPQEVVAPAWTFGEEVMVEPYIAGKELAVGVMDGKAMTVTDIIPRTGFYDYEAKYAVGGSTHVVPAPIRPHAFEKAMRMARWRTPRVAEASPGPTFVTTMLTMFLSAGGEHPARHDAHFARTRAGGSAGRGFRPDRALDHGGRVRGGAGDREQGDLDQSARSGGAQFASPGQAARGAQQPANTTACRRKSP